MYFEVIGFIASQRWSIFKHSVLVILPTDNDIRLSNCYYYYYIRLTAFSRTTWVSRHQKAKPFWILLEQEMMGWQWHQLDHMQIICILLQTDNHASTSPLNRKPGGK